MPDDTWEGRNTEDQSVSGFSDSDNKSLSECGLVDYVAFSRAEVFVWSNLRAKREQRELDIEQTLGYYNLAADLPTVGHTIPVKWRSGKWNHQSQTHPFTKVRALTPSGLVFRYIPQALSPAQRWVIMSGRRSNGLGEVCWPDMPGRRSTRLGERL